METPIEQEMDNQLLFLFNNYCSNLKVVTRDKSQLIQEFLSACEIRLTELIIFKGDYNVVDSTSTRKEEE